MATDPVHPVRPPHGAAAVALRGEVEDLTRAWERGVWTPTRLEQRIATLLSVATAGDGTLTAPRVREALWEGTVPLFRENGGRLAALLSASLRALEVTGPVDDGQPQCAPGPQGTGHDDGCPAAALDDAGRLLVAMAQGHARA